MHVDPTAGSHRKTGTERLVAARSDATVANLGRRSRILRASGQAVNEHGASAETASVPHAAQVGAEARIDFRTRGRLRRPGPRRVHELLRGPPERCQAAARPTGGPGFGNEGERIAEVEPRGQKEAFGRYRARKALERLVADGQLDTPPVEVRTPTLLAIRVPTRRESTRRLPGMRGSTAERRGCRRPDGRGVLRQGLPPGRRSTQTHEHDHASGGDCAVEDVGDAHRTPPAPGPHGIDARSETPQAGEQTVCQARQERLKTLVFSRLREERVPVVTGRHAEG